jgi:hypothetical protein
MSDETEIKKLFKKLDSTKGTLSSRQKAYVDSTRKYFKLYRILSDRQVKILQEIQEYQ